VCVGLVDHRPGATHPGVRYSQNADGTVAERVILVRVGDFAEFVALHPGASAADEVDELLAAFDAELGEDAINVSLHRPH
jgi:hypothetical protein